MSKTEPMTAAVRPYARHAAYALAAVLALAFLYAIRTTAVMIAVSFVLAYIGNPLIEILERRGLSRSWAIWLLMAGLLLLILFLFLIVVPQVSDQFSGLATKAPGWWKNIETGAKDYFANELRPALEWFGISPDVNPFSQEQIRDSVRRLVSWIQSNSAQIAQSFQAAFQQLFAGVTSFIIGFFHLIMIPVFTYYFLRDYHSIRAGFKSLLPDPWIPVFDDWAAEIDRAAGGFLRGQMMIALTLALIYSVSLSVIGVPMGAVLGLIAGLTNIVPYVSHVVGLIPTLLVSLIDSPNLWRLLWIGLIYLGGQLLEGLVLGPRVMGGEVGLHPVAVIVAMIAGGTLFGLAGLVLAVPVTAVLQVALIRWHRQWKTRREEAGAEA